MARTVEELAAVRDAIRRQWLLPVPGAFPGAAEIEDTSEETLALFAKQRLISGALTRALRSGNPAAIEAAIPRPPSLRGTGIKRTLHAGDNIGTAARAFSWGPFSIPFWIRQIYLAGHVPQGTLGTEGRGTFLILTGADVNQTFTRPAGQQVWPDDVAEAADNRFLIFTTGVGFSADIRPDVLVSPGGQFLTWFVDDFAVDAVASIVSIAVVIEELEVTVNPFLGLLSADRIRLNPSTRPPTPRTTAPPTPRGAIIRVTQGGRILAERRIPWEALDASIRAKWFAQQIGEPADGSIEWIGAGPIGTATAGLA